MNEKTAAHTEDVQPLSNNCNDIISSTQKKIKKKTKNKPGRKKNVRNCEIRPWLSANVDCREYKFIQVGESLFESKIYQGLSASARYLYLTMATESSGYSTVLYMHGTAKKYGIPSTTFERARAELICAGMIELLGEVPLPQFRPNVYKFVIDWKKTPLKKEK